MLTFNLVLNVILIISSVVWLVYLPLAVKRIIEKRSKNTFLREVCYSVLAVCWLLSVALPFREHGTLNTPHNDLFWLGLIMTWVPDLIAWWRTHRARAA